MRQRPTKPDERAAAAHHVVAIVLDGTQRADEVLGALTHLVRRGRLALEDAVVVAKSADGRTRVRETTDLSPAQGAVSGAWLGTLVGLLFGGPVLAAVAGAATGALYGKLVDVGLDDAWVARMAEWIDPGSSALLLLVDEAEMKDEVLRELGRYPGRVAVTTLPASVRRALEAACRHSATPDEPPAKPPMPA
jgi:uncharacterized membrane protein